MGKRTIIILFGELIFSLLWLLFFGQGTGVSGLYGNINFIDEGQYSAWIQHMLAGKTLYKDFYVQYGPLYIYPMYFFTKIFGFTIFWVRLFLSVIYVFLGIVIIIITLRYLKVSPILEIFVLFCCLLVPDVTIRFWIGILCLLLFVESYTKQSIQYAVLLGILVCLALLGSTEVGLYVLVLIVGYSIAHYINAKNTLNDIKIAISISLGFVIASGVFSIIAIHEGWFISYVRTSIDVLTTLSGVNLPNGQGLPDIFTILNSFPNHLFFVKTLFSKEMLFYWSLMILTVFLPITLSTFVSKTNSKKDSFAVLILLFSFLLYFGIVGRSGHYFVIVAFILVLSSYYLSNIFPFKSSKIKANKYIGIILTTIFVLYCVRHLVIFRYNIFPNIQQDIYTSVPRVAPLAIAKDQSKDIVELQNFFTKNTTQKDTLFVFNNAPAWYFLLNKENATSYDLPLLIVTKENRLKVVEELEENSPKFILIDRAAWNVDGVSDQKRLPEIYGYIISHYHLAKLITHYSIYQKNKNDFHS